MTADDIRDAIDSREPFDVVVIGGGSAGLAAAVAAAECGVARVLVLEREQYMGGVLPQCVHDGFGLHLYGESLTGPEYAERWISRARTCGVQTALASTVLSVQWLDSARTADGAPFRIEAIGASLGGLATLSARCVVCATGCRERTRGAMLVPGTRPAGVYTAGCAQYMVNVANQMPGDKAVVLGSGDIGLIMARRMVLEGAEVRMVLGQEATGLVRNHIRCIQDFGIPIRYGWGIARISGHGQLHGVTVAPLQKDGGFDLSRREYIRCNTLLIACGLIPEREVLRGVETVGESEGLFVCGNANVPHDLVDQVTQEGLRAGFAAAAHAARLRGGADVLAEPPADLARMARRSVSEPKGRMSEVHGRLPQGAQRMVCTVCPSGCVMRVSADGAVEGNSCARGEGYALRERECPTRVFTGTVQSTGGAGNGGPLLPVKTSCAVPKDKLGDVARACRRIKARAPLACGDVVCANVADTGANLVATATLGKESAE